MNIIAAPSPVEIISEVFFVFLMGLYFSISHRRQAPLAKRKIIPSQKSSNIKITPKRASAPQAYSSDPVAFDVAIFFISASTFLLISSSVNFDF